jgi:hypothetical protein
MCTVSGKHGMLLAQSKTKESIYSSYANCSTSWFFFDNHRRLLQDSLTPSPRRKPGSRKPQETWIPAFAGMTLKAFCESLTGTEIPFHEALR